MTLELDVQICVLRERDLQLRWVGRVVQEVLGNMTPIQRRPHLGSSASHVSPYSVIRWRMSEVVGSVDHPELLTYNFYHGKIQLL